MIIEVRSYNMRDRSRSRILDLVNLVTAPRDNGGGLIGKTEPPAYFRDRWFIALIYPFSRL